MKRKRFTFLNIVSSAALLFTRQTSTLGNEPADRLIEVSQNVV